jgi:hypothetical protein
MHSVGPWTWRIAYGSCTTSGRRTGRSKHTWVCSEGPWIIAGKRHCSGRRSGRRPIIRDRGRALGGGAVSNRRGTTTYADRCRILYHERGERRKIIGINESTANISCNTIYKAGAYYASLIRNLHTRWIICSGPPRANSTRR